MENEVTRQHQRRTKDSGNEMPDVKEKIQKQLAYLSKTDLEIVNNFIEAVKARKIPSADMYLLSEATLSKDWLRPEEDKAWKDL